MLYIISGLLFVIISSVIMSILLRRVVPANEVHIIQSRSVTKSYGKDTANGNIYYEWPSFVPVIGIVKTILPVSVFDLRLNSYDAYDQGRLPFVVDVVAFFRIKDSNMAAQRVASFNELERQLTSVVQGVIRTVLASHDIDSIMTDRSKFGDQFTTEVGEQLIEWGVITVKNIELMDIRDASGNQVIHNIMEKKKSLVEMQSRTEVAKNIKDAQIAEINAQMDTETQKQVAMKTIGISTALKDQEIGIATQKSNQARLEQEAITKTREMEVIKIKDVTQAEINKNVNIIEAEQTKQKTILVADGILESKKREAEAISIEGFARADAEKAMQLAPIQAQIELAKEIGENNSYQQYLITIRQVEANEKVGVEQAKALDKADIKIISNTGNPVDGMKNIGDVFSSKGGTSIGSMLEGLAQTESGKALIDKIIKK